MDNLIKNVLTSQEARDAEALKTLAAKSAEAGMPWWTEA